MRLYKFAPVFLILISLAVPFYILYSVNPSSFSRTWTGRTYYLFFLWLFLLEVILGWDQISEKQPLFNHKPSTLVFVVLLVLPTTYVVAVNFLGFESLMRGIVDGLNIPLAPILRPGWTTSEFILSVEYLVFATFFALSVAVLYGKEGLKAFSTSVLFIGAIGAVYMIDTLYPYGYFSPLQAFVPWTASLAAGVLTWIGYSTAFTTVYRGAPVLAVFDSSDNLIVQYAVGWPCAGVQSLMIYTFVMLIFLKQMRMPLLSKALLFSLGALVTYAVNILRIVSIYLVYIGNLSYGSAAATTAMRQFHSAGGIYSIAWIAAYPLLIILAPRFWRRVKKRIVG